MTRRNVFFFFSEKPPIAGIERKKGRKAVKFVPVFAGSSEFCIGVSLWWCTFALKILREMVVAVMVFLESVLPDPVILKGTLISNSEDKYST